MALIECSECGQEISDKAAACPQCGCPQAGRPIPPGYGNPGLLTNPRLPGMANWVCVYCLGVNPVLMLLNLPGWFVELPGFTTFHRDSPAFSLVLALLLVIADSPHHDNSVPGRPQTKAIAGIIAMVGQCGVVPFLGIHVVSTWRSHGRSVWPSTPGTDLVLFSSWRSYSRPCSYSRCLL